MSRGPDPSSSGPNAPFPGDRLGMAELSEAEMVRELRIEAFLAGAFSAAERAEFETEMRADPALAEAVAAQADLDTSLRAIYTPPAVVPPLPEIDVGGRSRSVPTDGGRAEIPAAPTPIDAHPSLKLVGGDADAPLGRRDPATQQPATARWARLAIAAILVLGVGIGVRLYVGSPMPEGIVPPASLYSRLVKTGWNPAVVCKDDAEFIALVEKQLGQGLSAAAATPAVQLVGWGYQNDYDGSPISPKTMMLLTRVDGEPVLVLIDALKNDRSINVDKASGLKLFRRTYGDLVVYELTPLDRERVLPSLSVPKK